MILVFQSLRGSLGIRTFSVKIGTVLDEPECIGGSVGTFTGQDPRRVDSRRVKKCGLGKKT